jgi:hypothetical protein
VVANVTIWRDLVIKKKLNDVEGKVQYQIKISNRYATLENSDDKTDMSRARESIKRNYKSFSHRGS